MPAGVPVGTLAIGQAGRGQRRLARRRHPCDRRSQARRNGSTNGATCRPGRSPNPPNDPAGLDHRHRRRRPAWAGCWPSRRRSSAIACHIFDPHEWPCAADVAAHFTRADFDDRAALRDFAERVDVATYEFENLPAEPLALLGDTLRPGLQIARRRPGSGRGEKLYRIDRRPRRAVAPGRIARGRPGGDCRARPAAGPQDPPLRL